MSVYALSRLRREVAIYANRRMQLAKDGQMVAAMVALREENAAKDALSRAMRKEPDVAKVDEQGIQDVTE